MTRFLIGFALGIAVSYTLIDRGINLPQHLNQAVNWHELEMLLESKKLDKPD